MPIDTTPIDALTTPMLAAAPTLAMSPMVINLLVGAFLLVSIVMILIVLIQRPQGGGLGGAFGAGGGGGGAGQTAFGTKTGDVLTWATIGIFVLFLLFAIGLNFATRPEARDTQPTLSAPGGPGAEPAPAAESPAPTDDSQADEDPISEDPGQGEPIAEPDAQEPAPTDPETDGDG